MLHKDYCSKCKRRGIPLVKYAKTKTTQYYYCRSCTNDRLKEYYTSGGNSNIYENQKRMNAKYPEKLKARQVVSYATKTKKLTKSSVCEVCGLAGRIEGHHMDYNKPLEVVWLCTACHSDYHNIN